MTAAVYMRGLLQHEYGVKPTEVEWVQGRTDRLGRKLPPDVHAHPGAGRHRAGRSARARRDRLPDDGATTRCRSGAARRTCGGCFRTTRELEQDYYRRTKIYPIMHTVVIRRDIYERDPWVALSLYQALCARQGALLPPAARDRLAQGVVRLAAADDRGGAGDHRRATGSRTASSRTARSIDALLQYTHEQGLTDRRVKHRGAVRAEHAARHPTSPFRSRHRVSPAGA